MNDFKIELDTMQPETNELKNSLTQYGFEVFEGSSAVGLDSIVCVFTLVDFVIGLIGIPSFLDMIKKDKVKVIFKGIEFNDTVSNINKILSSDSKLKDKVLSEYEKSNLTLQGNIKSVSDLSDKLDKLLAEISPKNE